MDDASLLREFDHHADTEPVVVRFTAHTWLGSHGLPQHLRAFAEQQGATVTHRVAGGWWHKTHYFMVRGTVAQVRRVLRFKMRMAANV